MSQPQLTDERLRYHLDANQPARERLCAALVSLAGPYSDVHLRRPMGGPDGGRDIEAVYADSLVVWGAVGFQNSAHDSPAQKSWVQKKFWEDLDRAFAEKPDLKGFLFCTNVDLTPGERAALKERAVQRGLEFVDILHRERLRSLLDSPQGLMFRFQYLNLPMTDSEQMAFFAHYGSHLEKIVTEGFGAIDSRLQRIEFLHNCSKPLMGGSLFVELRRVYSPAELGHFRVLAAILNMHEPDPHPALYLGGRDAYPVRHNGSSGTTHIGTHSVAWSRNPDEDIQATTFSTMSLMTDRLDFGAHLHKRGPFATLGSLDQRMLSVYVTKPMLEQIAGIGLVFNDYLIAGHSADDFVILESAPVAEWRGPLSEAEVAVPWVTVMLKNPEPLFDLPGADRKGWSLKFDEYTPGKVR